jgi:hypothetical protein
MKSSKNNDSNGDGEDEQPELRRSARKRKLNQLVIDGKPAGGEGDQAEPEECSSKKNREGMNDLDLEV